MTTSKRKINANTVANTEAKPIDSFFITHNNIKTITPPINIFQNDIKPLSSSPELTIQMQLNIQKNIIYSNQDIKNKLDKLSENELTEIFKIIKNNNEKYSTNKNGIFINLSTLQKNTIQELSHFIYFCERNDRLFDKEEEERSKYKDIIDSN
jgi:hypothetical protein